jgi:hypothetical protein
LYDGITLFGVYLDRAQATKVQQYPALGGGVTSGVMTAALNGNFQIVFPCKPNPRNDIGGRRAADDDAWASIKATVPNLA